jgi:hypothetical protein
MTPRLVVERLPASDPESDREVGEFLASCGTSFAQQTTHWRNVITRIDCDEPVWLGCRSGGRLVGVLPAYRFAGPLGAIMCTVPQPGALGGAAVVPNEEREAVFEALLVAFTAHAEALGCDLATAITNPFWPDRDLYERYFQPDYVLENVLQALSLSDDVAADGELPRASASLRRNLRRARVEGIWVDEEQSAANLEEWIEMHVARQTEIGVTPLPRELFCAAFEHMVPNDRARFFFVRTASGEMAAGGLYLHGGRVVDAFMPSICSKHANLRPGHLLAWHSIRWARRRGYAFYNWQASPPGGGVHRFKRQWGSREFPYCYLTRVTGDAAPYLEASAADLAAGYPRHFVLPFDVVGGAGTGQSGASSRASAWQAMEERT